MAISEVRTQIYLPRELFGVLKKQARQEKKSVAELVRRAIGQYLEERRRQDMDWENDPITRSLGSVVADADLAQDHDRYLYGWNKPRP